MMLCIVSCISLMAQTPPSSSSSTYGQQNQQVNPQNPPNNQNQPQVSSGSIIVPGTVGGYTDPLQLYSTPSSSSKVNYAAKNDIPVMVFKNDPTGTRMYRLQNGLTVYLSKNTLEPRIQTFIAVRAGSKNDPAETTGLAHYLEHMMFKGTDHIGTTNWERERIMLESIAQLYEQHRNEKNEDKKKEIYAEIDRLSGEAAKLAIPNEYDKMIGSLGAKGTNAWTSLEETVYVNDIPSAELERWLIVESERFHRLVLRLFHTELEAVYEEYNMGQDRDGSKMWKEFYKQLFPTNTYGTQTTIGEGEHLKNPSMYNIINYFTTYYVPNNMAICMSGDLDYDKTIAMINKYFGGYEPRVVPAYRPKKESPITSVKRSEVWGQEAEYLFIGYRLPGSNTDDLKKAKVIAELLSNGSAGLLDLDLNQQQLVLESGAFVDEMRDYAVLVLYANPKEGQSLEDCEQLLLKEMEKIRQGDYADWLMDAVIDNMRLQQTRNFESNRGRAGAHVQSFILGKDWQSLVDELDVMDAFSRSQLTDFAVSNLRNNNYVVVYKRQGEDNNVVKVDKPQITPVEANRESSSDFLRKFMDIPSLATEPEFVQYDKAIQTSTLESGIQFDYINNKLNDLFNLYYIFDMGSDNDLLLSLAVNYLPYLGTDKYSAAEIQEMFFRYGLSFNVSTSRDQTYVSLSGLEKNMEQGIALFEEILNSVKADKGKYEELVNIMLKDMDDAKSNKNAILFQALFSYGQYGESSPFKNQLFEKQLRSVNPNDLTDKIHQLESYPHKIFYYGSADRDKTAALIDQYHVLPKKQRSIPPATAFTEQPTDKNRVLFVQYDMVQAQILRISKDEPFNSKLYPAAVSFNEYFGSGLSSIVFQEIRETRALAYSAWANYTIPGKANESHYVRSYVATQADKMQLAIEAMNEIMNEMPQAEEQFIQSLDASRKKIESERITRTGIYWSREAAAKRGLNYDIRQDAYEALSGMSLYDLNRFFEEHIADRTYTYLVIGDKNKLDMDYLRSLGEFKELTLEEIFGY